MNSLERVPSEMNRAIPPMDHSRTIRSGGISWRVRVMGTGPVMLLLHGTGASSDSFRELAPLLAQHFTIVAPDLPGHAGTERPSWFDPSLPAIARALRDLLAALDLTPVVAVGHSAGAAILARMVLDGAIAPVLLVGLGAALVPFQGIASAFFPPAARLLSLASRMFDFRVSSTASVEVFLQSTGSHIDAGGVEIYRRLLERPEHIAGVLAIMARWDLAPLYAELPELRVPFLLLAGERDRAVPVLQQREAAARIPNARLEVLEKTGHLLHEEAPRAIAALVLDEARKLKAAP